MPWTKKDYPASMKNLPASVRNKAIEIANALLEEEGMEEGIAIATAISRAKDWATEHGKSIKSTSKSSRSTDVKEHGEDRYVIPYEGEWAVKKEGKKKVEKVYRTRQKAVSRATKEVKEAKASLTVQRKSGKVAKRVSYNPNQRAKKTTRKSK